MDRKILGIHHITAIASDPQQNVDFYSGVLGLRLVKLTVNFDDPGTYHLYYGDGVGSPGTILTFFPWPKAPRGKQGNGQVTETVFAIPLDAIGFWEQRLTDAGIEITGAATRFGEQVISFADPDGMKVELVASTSLDPAKVHRDGPVPVEAAIHGFHSATLSVEGYAKTAALLTETMGFAPAGSEGNRFRYTVQGGKGAGTVVDVRRAPEERRGNVLAGTVHHIAWRVADEEEQIDWLGEVSRLGYNVSPVMDRNYFHSIYFREPGGILFEIATDPPGFTVDEPLEEMGKKLLLPPWLEPSRAQLESVLPPLRLPSEALA